MCMGGCGGSSSKKSSSTPKKQTAARTAKPKGRTVRTNWAQGFGMPKVKFTFGR